MVSGSSSDLQGSLAVGRRKADGRPLSALDKIYFTYRLAFIGGILVYRDKHFLSEKKMTAAFQQAVRMSPLMQTRVMGGGSSLDQQVMFEKVDEKDWPSLVIESEKHTTNESAVARGRDLLESLIAAYRRGENDIHRGPLSMVVVKGHNTIVVTTVVSHYFLDGTAIGEFLKKWAAYVFLSRSFWPLVDRASTQDVPTVEEMVMKNKLHQFSGKPMDNPGITFGDEYFRFLDYSPQSIRPDEASRLKGLAAEVVSDVTAVEVKKSLIALRACGITMSSAFTALAIKLLATIVAEHEQATSSASADTLKLVACLPIDARKCGEWGDARDKRSRKFAQVGNYTLACWPTFSFKEVLEKTIEELAVHIRKITEKTLSDPRERWQNLTGNVSMVTRLPYVCGVSSVRIPEVFQRFGLAPLHVSGAGRPETSPRSWLSIVTTGNRTTVTADVMLPIEGLSPEYVRQKLKEIVTSDGKSSAIGPMFPHL